jgi:exodeoxyribonuclease VII large subunit
MQVTDFCNKIKSCLPTGKFKIIGEVNQPKLSHGHLYFNFKDNNSNIKCILWKTKLDKCEIKIEDGDKIIIEVKIDFYSFTGSVNFIVENIIENLGIGNLQKKYEQTKLEFENKGYFKKENKLELPCVIKNIVIITSENGAAIKDFLFNLENKKSKIKYNIIDVPVQGYDCHKIISAKLKDIYDEKIVFNNKIDAIIITRGGGSFQDLFAFSEPELIETVYKYKNTDYKYKKIPIISAIGHQIDNPLLDFVADINCPTPSLASQYLIDHNINFINRILEIKNTIKNKLINSVFIEQKKIVEIKNKMKQNITLFLEKKNIFKNQIEKELYKQKEELIIIKNKINMNFSGIKLYKNNNKLTTPNEIIIGDQLELQWNNKKFKISILSN